MVEFSKFDVFLAHNSADKPQVREIAQQLRRRGLKPWLDEDEILGGDTILEAVYRGISQSKTGAFFIGSNGLGHFQENIELYTVIQWFLNQKKKSQSFRVIPILLQGIDNVPNKIGYLEIWRWIKFNQINDTSALDDLVRSIRGRESEAINISDRASDYIRPEILHSPQTNDDLGSDRNIDYTRLRDLLKAGNWKYADYETYLVMLKVVGRKDGDWIRDQELLNFPCTDLRTIDNLWIKYSNGRFGFSVQKKIYLEVGGILDGEFYEEAWEKFGDCVGWRVNQSKISYNLVTFDTTAQCGHLPCVCAVDWVVNPDCATKFEPLPLHRFAVLHCFSRLATCKVG